MLVLVVLTAALCCAALWGNEDLWVEVASDPSEGKARDGTRGEAAYNEHQLQQDR